MDCARAVSQLTGYDFEKTFAMPVVEFFAYIAYINFDRRREEARLKRINKKY